MAGGETQEEVRASTSWGFGAWCKLLLDSWASLAPLEAKTSATSFSCLP